MLDIALKRLYGTIGQLWIDRRLAIAKKLGWPGFLVDACRDTPASGDLLFGEWDSTDAAESSNHRELKAVALSLKRLAPELEGRHVRIRTDNTCTMWTIRRQGSAKSLKLLALAKNIWALARRYSLTLSMEYIPGVENTEADRLSRLLPRDDHSLTAEAVSLLQKEMGPLTLDLFAEDGTALLPRYVSWRTSGGEYHDAFSRKFPDEGGLAHPPPKLIGRVLQKFAVEKPSRLVLVTPNWKSLPHLPLLRGLAPRSVLIPRRMLQGPPGHRLEKLRCGLIAWLLLGSRC